MATQSELSKSALVALRGIKKKRGMTAFCEKALINPRTFKKLCKTGTSDQAVITRVENALDLPKPKEVTIESIAELVAGDYEITVSELKRAPRKTLANEAKQVTAYLSNKETRHSPKFIANEIGYKDRTGVLQAISTITDRMHVERDLRGRVYNLQAKINQ